jgi:hypothetical protein
MLRRHTPELLRKLKPFCAIVYVHEDCTNFYSWASRTRVCDSYRLTTMHCGASCIGCGSYSCGLQDYQAHVPMHPESPSCQSVANGVLN